MSWNSLKNSHAHAVLMNFLLHIYTNKLFYSDQILTSIVFQKQMQGDSFSILEDILVYVYVNVHLKYKHA